MRRESYRWPVLLCGKEYHQNDDSIGTATSSPVYTVFCNPGKIILSWYADRFDCFEDLLVQFPFNLRQRIFLISICFLARLHSYPSTPCLSQGCSVSTLRISCYRQKARKMGLLEPFIFDLYMKIALSQAEVLCKDSKMDCIFTPGVNARTYACCGRVSPKRVG